VEAIEDLVQQRWVGGGEDRDGVGGRFSTNE
jgi:hypothetical protein